MSPKSSVVFLTANDLQPKAESTSLFFTTLPRELRDVIYQHLWMHTPNLRQRYKDCIFAVTYGEQVSLCRDRALCAHRKHKPPRAS
jgi:hypothetical protein